MKDTEVIDGTDVPRVGSLTAQRHHRDFKEEEAFVLHFERRAGSLWVDRDRGPPQGGSTASWDTGERERLRGSVCGRASRPALSGC